MIQVPAPVAVTLVLAFLGLVFAFGRILLNQFEKRMAERFQAQDRERDVRLRAIEETQQRENLRMGALIDEVRRISQVLPLEYVRREDWIRFSAQIDHKLDRLAELVLNQGVTPRARD